jgi:SAM-dependent methyltransferase
MLLRFYLFLAWLCFSRRETKCYNGLDLRGRAIKACEDKAQEIARTLLRDKMEAANIGAGKSRRWQWLVKGGNDVDVRIDPDLDLNTSVLSGQFDLTICEQVIEHLHNTTHFLSELAKITRAGGHLLISTENLASWPNRLMLLAGLAPFSTQPVCGAYVGGWKKGIHTPECTLEDSHPTFSGQRGHVRVLTKGQLKSLLEKAGFHVVSTHGYGFNHYVLFHCIRQPVNFACFRCASRQELNELIYLRPVGKLTCKYCQSAFHCDKS